MSARSGLMRLFQCCKRKSDHRMTRIKHAVGYILHEDEAPANIPINRLAKHTLLGTA